jgi:hypothetical protein
MKLAAKKKEKEKPVAGGEKKSKRKASRGSGEGLAKLKSFVVNHIEKLLLGTMGLFALFLVYSGFSKDPLDKDPDAVRAAISQARSSIDRQTWAQVKQERQPEPDRFDQQAEQDIISIDPTAYAMIVPFHPRLQEQGKRRTDPELLAPFDIEVRPGFGALAIKSSNRESSISSVVGQNSTDLRSIPSELTDRMRDKVETSMGGTYQGRFFVAITGLIPYQKQFEIYREAFEGAAEYDTERDVPTYVGLEIERAEVQTDGTLSPWEPLNTYQAMSEPEALWESRLDERADQDHLLRDLVMPLPPLVLRDLDQWARHSSVPEDDANQVPAGGEPRGEPEAGQATEQPPRRSWSDRPNSRSAGTRHGTPAADEPPPETTSGEVAQPLLKVENGMLRFFDFTVEPGKKYQYRVQAVLEDPNNPESGKIPAPASCEPDVVLRRESATDHFRQTAWSEPTDTVVVPTGDRVLASTASMPNTLDLEVGSRTISVERRATDEPTIDLVAVTWKADGPYDVPVPLKAARGSVLNGAVEKAEAIDPAASRVRALNNYRYATGAMVLDIYGGSIYPGSNLTAPGFVLVRTADGRLEFRAESADFAQVELNTIPPDEEAAREAERRRTEAEQAEERGRAGDRDRAPPAEGRGNLRRQRDR